MRVWRRCVWRDAYDSRTSRKSVVTFAHQELSARWRYRGHDGVDLVYDTMRQCQRQPGKETKKLNEQVNILAYNSISNIKIHERFPIFEWCEFFLLWKRYETKTRSETIGYDDWLIWKQNKTKDKTIHHLQIISYTSQHSHILQSSLQWRYSSEDHRTNPKMNHEIMSLVYNKFASLFPRSF